MHRKSRFNIFIYLFLHEFKQFSFVQLYISNIRELTKNNFDKKAMASSFEVNIILHCNK